MIKQRILGSINRLAFLDILRFIAAIIIVIAHMYDKNQFFHTFDLKKKFPIFHTGVAGVIIFFLISGYIMPYTIAKCCDLKDFLIKRCIRIYPLLMIVMMYGLLRYGEFEKGMIPALILPIADFIAEKSIVRGVDWTLRVEFFYYVLIAVVYFKNKFNFRSTIFFIVITSLLIIITYFYHEKYFNYRLIYLNFIFLGSLLYLIEKDNFNNIRNNIYTLIAIISSITIFEVFRVIDIYLFPGMLFGVITFLFFYCIHQTKFRINSNSFIVLLGNLSYPSYLLHLMIYEDLFTLFDSHIMTMLIFLNICYFVYLFVEKPITTLLKIIILNHNLNSKLSL